MTAMPSLETRPQTGFVLCYCYYCIPPSYVASIRPYTLFRLAGKNITIHEYNSSTLTAAYTQEP